MLSSLHCPTCEGPVPKEVLEAPVQCLYCDIWITTTNGQPRGLQLSRKQSIDMARGIPPTEPMIREDSGLGRLVGRWKRLAPIVLGVPMGWVLLMHLYVGMGWVSVSTVPMSGDGGFVLFTLLVWGLAAISGYGMFAALTASAFALSQCGLLYRRLQRVEDIGRYLESESGIIAMCWIGIPGLLAVGWAMMQSKESLRHFLLKLKVARLRVSVAIVLGLVAGWAFFSRPTYTEFLQENRAKIVEHTTMFAKLCTQDSAEAKGSTQPLIPKPTLEFPWLKDAKGNVQTVLCSRALSQEWWLGDKKKHPDLMMATDVSYILYQFYLKHPVGGFLTSGAKAHFEEVFSTPYWLLYDPRPCQSDQGEIIAQLYAAQEQAVVRRLKVVCSPEERDSRKALLKALSETTGGDFKAAY